MMHPIVNIVFELVLVGTIALLTGMGAARWDKILRAMKIRR